MGERVRQIITRVRDFVVALSLRAKIAIGVVAALAVAVIIGLLIYRSTRPYEVLFTGMSSDDMISVLNYLEVNGVNDYQVQNNDTVLVREGQEASLKAAILQQGYPTSGFGYETYLENINSLSSESDRQRLYLYDLQDRLSAVVRCFDGVRDAHVTITQSEDHRYILSDDIIEAKAGVIMTMETGRTLTQQQATAIRRLISNSVQNVQMDNVAISDTAGNDYTGISGGGESTAAAVDSAQVKLELEAQVNEYVRENVIRVLSPLFGQGNLSVSVNSTVEMSHTYEDATIYEQPTWAEQARTGRGIIGSQIWDNSATRSNEDGTVGGVVGTTPNADIEEYEVNENQMIDGNELDATSSGEVHYNVSERNSQTERLGGTITDIMVAVTINSDVYMNTGGEDEPPLDPPDNNMLIQLVARAAGIDAAVQREKVAVYAYPFYQGVEPPTPVVTLRMFGIEIQGWMLYAMIGGLILFLILLIVILILRRRSRLRKQAEAERQHQLELERAAAEAAEAERIAAEAAAAAAAAAEAAKNGADIMDIHTERSMELRQKIREFVEENPEIAAQMIKIWMRGGEE